MEHVEQHVNTSPTREEFMAANRLINTRIRGWMDGAERFERARNSSDPQLRQAAQTVAAYRAANESASGQAGGTAQTVNVGVAVARTTTVSPAPRRPLMQPSATRREISGRYLSPKSFRQFDGVRRLLRDLRESAKDGAK